MAFDASVVKCFVEEANKTLINGKIDKIHQPQKDEIVISLRSSNKNIKLHISANPNFPRIYLTNSKFDNPEIAPMFCMLLRKHLVSYKITAISQYDFERIVVLELEGYDELSDLTTKKLVIELLGKYSNIILLDNQNKIIDCIKRIDISTSTVRQVLPMLTYKFPEKQNKINPMEYNFDNITINEENPEADIMSKIYGIGKITAREICYLAEKTSYQTALKETFDNIKNNSFKPCVIYNHDSSPLDFSATEILQYGNELKIEYTDTISEAIEKFYSGKALRQKLNNFSSQIEKLLSNNIERCEKKLKIFNQQLLDAAGREKYKQYGELITANIYQIKDGMKEATVLNYFDENYPEIKIKLSPELSPAQNAQKYFSKYNKAKTTEEQSLIQIEKTEKELNYLETVSDALNRAEDIQEIIEIKEELANEGYITITEQSKKKKKAKTEVSKPKEYVIDGYTVYVGKNNRQNDYLTLKMARSHDMWLHTKNIPGSHVIIVKKYDEEIPDKIIIEAAKLAALNSKAKSGAKTPVDFTEVKNVKKPSGAKPGMVIYDNYNTTYVSQ